jgi:hypothetical protein
MQGVMPKSTTKKRDFFAHFYKKVTKKREKFVL